MTDSMNFGPEWLRNLSSDGSTSGGGVGASGGGGSRPQLADFRYGREEMLTLFTKGLRPPSSLTNYPMLYANTAQGQLPLALTPMTEDERGSLGGWTLGAVGGGSGTRGGIGGINTSAMTGRGGGGRSISMTGGGSRGGGMSATRGGSGRGGATGGGGGWQPTNHNGSSLDATEWSPRKEYMSGGGGGGSYRSQSLVTDNWRKGARIEGGMDGDGAITGLVPQGQGQEGWRQGQQIRPVDRSNPSPTTSVPSSDPPPQRWMQRSTSWRDDTSPSANNASANPPSRGPQQRRVWDEDSHTGHLHHQQQLPEWALEQVSEPGGGTVSAGSFDATGAFHGERDREREHREAAGGGLYKSTSQKDIGSGGNSRVGAPLATSRSALALGMKSGGDRTGQGSSVSQVSSGANVNKEHPPDASSDKRHSDDANVKEKGRPIVEENIMQQPQNINKGNSVQQLINGCVNGVALSKREPFENSAINRDRVVDRGDEDFDRLQEDLVLKLVVDEEPSSNNGLGGRGANVGVGIVNHAQQPPPPPNLVPPSSEKWFYQDPQGDLQGPFMARDMADWYRAGYFSVALLVRRGCDERFFCLGDLVAGCQGGNPFQVSPLIQPPPLLLRDSRDQLQQQQQQQQQQHRVVEHREAPPAVVNGPSGPGPAPMLPDHPDLLQLQILQQQIAYRQHQQHQQQQQQQQYNNQQPPVVQANNHRSSIVEASPASWASLSALQQQELLAQQMLQQSQHSHQHVQHQQISAPPTNPLMHMISQIQQGVKGAAGLMDQQQVPVQAIPAPLQPPSQTSTQPLNPLETFLAQMGNLQQQTSVSQPPPVLHTDPTHPPPQSQTSSSTTTQSNPLLEMFRMKPSFPVHQQQQQVVQQSTTQLEQLAMWQKNHQYNSGSVMHLQHVQQQQQQWRAMQQQQQSQQQQQQQQSQVMQQEQSVGLWDVSTPSTQTAPIVSPQSTISSVINQQQLSHHSSPSPPLQQHQQQQQQIAPQTKVQQLQQQPSTTVPQDLVKSVVYNRTSIPLAQQVQEPVTTPGKKKQIAVTDGVTAEKKKEEEKLKKKEQSKKQDSEKKQAAIVVDEKQRKKEEEKAARIKEEKAKQRESDERKAKEHEQKRKAKEQRKIDEENRKKAEEQKRLDDIDRERQAARDRDEHLRRQQQTLEEAEQTPPQPQAKVLSPAPPAPWLSTPPVSSNHAPMLNTVSPSPTTNLADIQRAEREKRSAEQQQQQQMAAAAVVLYQQQQAQLMQLEREQQESKTFSWASKPLKVGKVKSLAAIQAEEHELLLKKQVEEQRLAAVKEKEAAAVPTAGIWSGQSLTWATENIASPNTGGFWDEAPRIQKQQQIGIQQVGSSKVVSSTNVQQLAKPTVTAGNVIIAKKSQQQSHLAGNRKDTNAGKNNNNNDSTDEFSNWCSKLLANINANVDVPTFIGFLRDIESAFDVREYCRDYLGDSGATQQFAAQFLEKRRLFKPNRSVAHKDDMCAPAPALTPNHHAGGVATVPVNVTAATASANVCYGSSLRETSGNGSSANVISTDFQEVKGKGKKVKKSKMLKVDSRILGFSVTAAPDRFNVGDRDYGDTT